MVDFACAGLEICPHEKQTAELRTLLLEMASLSASHASAWDQLVSGLAAVGEDGPHLQLDESGRVRLEVEHAIEEESSDIPF